MSQPTTSAPVTTTITSTTTDPNPLLVYLRHRIHLHARATLFWGIGFSIYALMIIAIFPSFEESGALNISQYPEAMREAFNLTAMDTIEPYLSSQIYNYMPLILSFLPITAFAGAIAGAEEHRTLDVLLGNPLPRPVFIVATWLAVATLMVTMLLVVGLIQYGSAVALDIDLAFSDAMLSTLNLVPITMLFGSVALLISAIVRQRAVATGVSVAILFLMYLIDIIGKISDTWAQLRNVSAFKAYGDVLQDGMPWGGAALLLAIAIGLAALAIPVFQRRDIYT